MMERMELGENFKMNEKEFVQRYFEDINREFNNDSSDNEEIPMQGESHIEIDEITIQEEHHDSEEDEVKTCVKKPNHRSNLAEFGVSISYKKKNGSAKREMTSVVHQLGKIDKQMTIQEDCDSEGDEDKTGVKKPKRRSNLAEFGDSLSIKRKNESAKRELTSGFNQLGKIDKQLNTKEDNSRVGINFIAKFTSFKSNRVNTFKYPVDAQIKHTFLDRDTTIATVKNAVKEAFDDLLKELPRNEADIVVTESSTAPDDLMTPTKTITAFTALPSPVTVKGQPVSSKNLCAKNSCTFGKKQRKHIWIKCCYKSGEGQGCSYWVHATCLGFPTLKDEDVKMMDGWCCPEHTEIIMKRK